ncbi:MAG: flagellar basal body rod protein FlgB [Rickettsiaceae bacterium]|nr:flagellar basal body rod protein FlgB [Rickettsiaceae bacterium]
MSDTDIALENFLNFTTTRQEVVAENIANANTPGELAKDIKLPASGDAKKPHNVTLRTTSPMHIPGSKPKSRYKTVIDASGDLKPNGNNIDLTVEAKKATENRIQFDTALRAYRASADLLKTALGKGR